MARVIRKTHPRWQLAGIDYFIRPGSETNRVPLAKLGVKALQGDILFARDLGKVPAVGWVIEGAANPGVLAGVDGRTRSHETRLICQRRQKFCGLVSWELEDADATRIWRIGH